MHGNWLVWFPYIRGGSRFEQGHYRPISLLPVPGKILEKIVHARLVNHLEVNSLLVENQGGFRSNHSTTSSVAALTDDIFSGINCQKVTVAIFADLAKAFNTVNHKILLVKFIKLGVTGQLLARCRNYLESRKQRTLANNVISGVKDVPCGVPQCSVLGPLFFLVYINDLVYSLKHVLVKLYADDTVLYMQHDGTASASAKIQAGLDIFSKWCGANKLSFNPKKTKQVNFGSRHQLKKQAGTHWYIGGKVIQKVPSFKYLGIILDPTLTFNLHARQVCNTVGHKMYMLGKIRR